MRMALLNIDGVTDYQTLIHYPDFQVRKNCVIVK